MTESELLRKIIETRELSQKALRVASSDWSRKLFRDIEEKTLEALYGRLMDFPTSQTVH